MRLRRPARGDEFAALFRVCGAREAAARCEKVREQVAAMRWGLSADGYALTVSIVIAAWTAALADGHELMRAAAAALLDAKGAGRNRVGVR